MKPTKIVTFEFDAKQVLQRIRRTMFDVGTKVFMHHKQYLATPDIPMVGSLSLFIGVNHSIAQSPVRMLVRADNSFCIQSGKFDLGEPLMFDLPSISHYSNQTLCPGWLRLT